MNTPKTNLMRRTRDPFEMMGVTAPFGRLFDAFMREPGFVSLAETDGADTLAIDLSETETDVLVRASLPGFKRDQVHIEVDDGVLRIEAHREETSEEKSPEGNGAEKAETWIRRERREQHMTRAISLPTAVDQDNAKAELADGVLTLTLPKAQVSTRRRIEIS
ncbi:MAG: Hsp20/alpha crystallin family protein [Phycisphaerales bacterium JB040]